MGAVARLQDQGEGRLGCLHALSVWLHDAVGGSGDEGPPPGFEHVQAGTHSLDSVTDRLADTEVGCKAWVNHCAR